MLTAGGKGFTLLEVMLAMTILAIVLFAVYESKQQSLAMTARARFLTEAALLAQGRMAIVDAADPAGLADAAGDFGGDHPGYLWELQVRDTEIPFLRRVELIVSDRSSPPMQYRLVLYKVQNI